MNSLRICFYLCVGLLWSPWPAAAQYISSEQIFPVEGYSVFQMGYPIRVAPAGQGNFAFLEFWVAGKQGRRVDNYYLQAYGINDYAENWFKPVTNEGFEPMIIGDLIKLEKCFAVVGKQYQAKAKGQLAVARFFSLDGSPFAAEPELISTFAKPSRRQREWVLSSPKGKYLAWVGVEKERTHLTLWGNNGSPMGEKIIELPYTEEKYEVAEVVLNDAGELFFLMRFSRPGNEQRPLVLNKYSLKEDRFLTTLINLDPLMPVSLLKLGLSFEQDILIMGGLSSQAGPGLSNGAKLDGGSTSALSHVFCQRLSNGNDELKLEADSVSAIPEKWVNFFTENGGSNFSSAKLVTDREGIAMLWEEVYENKKRFYNYSLGILGFDEQTGGLKWDRLIDKRQRDQGSRQFLSYVSGVAKSKIRLVYLSERGARGNLMCVSIDLETGDRKDKILASNETAEYLIFPAASGMVSGQEMLLVGMGNPSQNNYKLITITF